jgi:hypothetical protein
MYQFSSVDPTLNLDNICNKSIWPEDIVSGTALVWHTQGPEFNPKHCKKTTAIKKKELL